MAYVDQNGIVVINEVEAANDVAKLKNILDLLHEALEYMKQIENINSAIKGDANITVDYASAELMKQINNQVAETNNLIKTINEVVEKYRRIDAAAKNQINTSMN